MQSKTSLYLTGLMICCLLNIPTAADEGAEPEISLEVTPPVSKEPTALISAQSKPKKVVQSAQKKPDTPPPADRRTAPLITGDFIYWSANQLGLPFVADGITGMPSAQPRTAPHGKEYSLSHRWDPGFKVGVGLNCSHDKWQVYADYTWFHNHANGHKNDMSDSLVADAIVFFDNGGGLFIPVNVLHLRSAEAHWNLRFNVIDLSLGRNFFTSDYLKMKAHFGLKGSWQNQNFKLNYVRLRSTGFEAFDYTIHQKQSFLGVGIRGGVNTVWYFVKNWSIFGDLSLSALYSRFHNQRKDDATVISTFAPTQPVNISQTLHAVQPVLEFALGLKWETWFHRNTYNFSLQAGWEEQVWFDQNQYITLDEFIAGNLTLQGLTVKMCFAF